jgi:hypothetical protein
MNAPTQRHLGAFYGRLVIRGTALLAVLLAFIMALSLLEQWRTDRELGAILSALCLDPVLERTQEQSTGREIQIIFLREPKSLWKRDGYRRGLLFEGKPLFSGSSSPLTRASFILSNVLPRNIQAALKLPNGARDFFISRKELEEITPAEFKARFPNEMGYTVVSHAGLNLSGTEAILYFDHFCGPFGGSCGGGQYLLMRKVNGVWRIVDGQVIWTS